MNPTVVLLVRRVLKASPERLFDAWTQPEQLRQWWGPRPVTCVEAEVDLRVGGHYRIANRLPGGDLLWIVGTFETIEPPRKLVYTWSVESREAASKDADPSRVTVRF